MIFSKINFIETYNFQILTKIYGDHNLKSFLQKQAENGLQSRSGYHGLSWMTFMDDCHRQLSSMTFMDNFHGWLSWLTFMDDFHGWLDFAVYKLFLYIADRLTDRQTDRQTDIGTP